jgi:Zn-dependent alcohol dehydrogenase
VGLLVASTMSGEASAADVPVDRVMVAYFHRTERCPTCLTMGAYSEEAVKTGFAGPVKAGTVSFHYVDYQDPRNAALAKAYGIDGPALIVGRIAGGKVVEYANLTDIWTKVADKADFFQYVRDQVAARTSPPDRVVAMYFHRTQRCPTCLKMGSYSEEAVKAGFAERLKDGTVAFYDVDFQDPRNATLVKRYDVTGPTLVVAKVTENRVVESRHLADIWAKAPNKQAFLAYVRENVAAYCGDLRPQDAPGTAVTRAR